MKIEIERCEPAFGGMAFGEVGAYRKIVGRALGKVDPAHTFNSGIVNLAWAPADAAGLVTYECPFYLLVPADLRRGNRACSMTW